MRTAHLVALALTLVSLAVPTAAHAERHLVKMLNRGAQGGLVYEPDFLRVRPGDTVKFLATDSTHNAASMPEMLPNGASPFKGQINQEIEVQFDVPGLYGIRCIPHYAMGMVMLVQVGDGSVQDVEVSDGLPDEVRHRIHSIIERESTQP